MATKQEILEYIKKAAEQKNISKEELDAAFNSGNNGEKNAIATEAAPKKIGAAEIFYYIGGGIVFLGIAILLSQNWQSLNFATKILATLGSGIAAYFVGLLFSRDGRTGNLSPAFFLISALVMPIGLFVLFDNAGFDARSYEVQSLISAAMLGTLLVSLFLFKKNIFAFFSILFGTWFFFSLTSFLANDNSYFDVSQFYEYRFLVAGIAYILLAYAFSKNRHTGSSLQSFLYGFGVIGFLVAAFALGGFDPNQNVFWELLYPILVFGVLFLSVKIKSKTFLMAGTIALMAFIFKITSEYFSSGLGWPLALVIAGFAMIGAGYFSFSLKKKLTSER